MFKKSFIGYDKKGVEESVARIEQGMSTRLEEVQSSLTLAIAEQGELVNKSKLLPSRLERARSSTILIEQYQARMSMVIDELRKSIEVANAKKLDETEIYGREIRQQVDLLEGQIETIKKRINGLLQSLAELSDSVSEGAAEDEKLNVRLVEMMNEFKTRVEVSEVKITNAIEPQNPIHLVPPQTIEEELPALRIDYTTQKEPAVLRIAQITLEDTIRANIFMDDMRKAWKEEVPNKALTNIEEESTRDEIPNKAVANTEEESIKQETQMSSLRAEVFSAT